MRTNMHGAALPTTEDAILSTPNQRSRLSLTVVLRSKTFSQQAFRWTVTGLPQLQYLCISQIWSCVEATVVFNMLIHVSEKNCFCVIRGLRTKSSTHAIAPFISSRSIATTFKDTVKLGRTSENSLFLFPLSISVVN